MEVGDFVEVDFVRVAYHRPNYTRQFWKVKSEKLTLVLFVVAMDYDLSRLTIGDFLQIVEKAVVAKATEIVSFRENEIEINYFFTIKKDFVVVCGIINSAIVTNNRTT